MTDEQKSKCHKIIHTAAVSAGAIGAGLAPIPGSATVPITGIQIGMIVSLGAVFGLDITKSAAASILDLEEQQHQSEDKQYHNSS